jgi:hypothetical protein
LGQEREGAGARGKVGERKVWKRGELAGIWGKGKNWGNWVRGRDIWRENGGGIEGKVVVGVGFGKFGESGKDGKEGIWRGIGGGWVGYGGWGRGGILEEM